MNGNRKYFLGLTGALILVAILYGSLILFGVGVGFGGIFILWGMRTGFGTSSSDDIASPALRARVAEARRRERWRKARAARNEDDE